MARIRYCIYYFGTRPLDFAAALADFMLSVACTVFIAGRSVPFVNVELLALPPLLPPALALELASRSGWMDFFLVRGA